MNEIARTRIDALRPLLKDEDPDVRDAVATAIERLEATGGIDEVLHALKTGDMGARVAAIHALGEIGGDRVVAPLVYCAGRPEADIRSAAVEALGRLAVPSTLPVLLERLDDENGAIRARAIGAVARFLPSPVLYERLRPFLEATDGALEAEAALALAKLNDLSSEGRITALLASPHASTRQAAATALSLLPLEFLSFPAPGNGK
ncbi:HEAT repeat domain-containing protein [Oryzomonas sagensis]|uniref:HEAT repeat domain-containing protein n=1 Tax=Oryzomonas sagensis TaxID=2603857 RepID=A0ABQ6TR97_9BACT|nr:HEAT repeat domain-containing protein [Oryzomonas sagensis]KAB0671509.1 HEAT repeat domain-containing protein [Oryzomonas sagensis]